MTPSRSLLTFGIITIAFGVFWLLAEMQMLPDARWIWTAFLAGCGALAFFAGGINRTSIVVGPWFFAAAAVSALRNMDKLSFERGVPILVIVFGVLLLVSAMIPADSPRPAQNPTPPTTA